MRTAKLLRGTAVALFALAPLNAWAQLVDADVNVDRGGVKSDVNVGGDHGADADADVGGGSGSGSVSIGGGHDGDDGDADADVNVGGGGAGGSVSIGGGSGGGGGSDGGGGTDGGTGGGTGGGDGGGSQGGGGSGGGTGGGTGGATTGNVGDGDGGTVASSGNAGDPRAIMLGNGQPAAALIGLVIYSRDGAALGVVQDIVGFDGTRMRIGLMSNSALGLASRMIVVDIPVDRLTQREVRLSLTRDEFLRLVSA